MSDLVGNQNVGFLMTRLILIISSVPVSTSNLPLLRLGQEILLASVVLKHIGLNQAAQAAAGGLRGG